jgi:RNA polymerase sigma factor (sigma-70 family)
MGRPRTNRLLETPGTETPRSAQQVRDETWGGKLLEALADRTLAGDNTARSELLVLLMPWIKRCVIRTINGGLRASSEAEIEDFVADVLVWLMENDHAVLRKWAHKRHSLSGYIATVTRNLIVTDLRTKSKNPRTNRPLPDDPSGYEGVDGDLEMRIEAEEYERVVFAMLEERLNKRGLQVLELTRAGRSVEDIARMAKMTEGAVHSQHSQMYRLIEKIRRLLDERTGR